MEQALADLAGLRLGGGTNVLGLMAVDTLGNWVHAAEGGLVLTAPRADGSVVSDAARGRPPEQQSARHPEG